MDLLLNACIVRIVSSEKAPEIGFQIEIKLVKQFVFGREVNKQRSLCNTGIFRNLGRGCSNARQCHRVGCSRRTILADGPLNLTMPKQALSRIALSGFPGLLSLNDLARTSPNTGPMLSG